MFDISFFSDEVDFMLSQRSEVNSWLKKLVEVEGGKLHAVNIVFVSDDKLLEMNNQFLGHDYYTDILTFPNEGSGTSGELYISIDRVKENAVLEGVELTDEVHRVMAHGMLHLLGYQDKSEEQRIEMRTRELFYLNLRTF